MSMSRKLRAGSNVSRKGSSEGDSALLRSRRRVRPEVTHYDGVQTTTRARRGWARVERGGRSGHLGDVQVRVHEVELVHVDDFSAGVAGDPPAHVVGR